MGFVLFLMNSRWSLIAGRLPGRTDNEIKNYWNTHIKRKLISRGIDPQTHGPLNSTVTATAVKASPQKLEFKPTIDPRLIPQFGLISQTINFKSSYPDPNNTLKLIRADSGGTCNSGTTDDGQQTRRATHPQKAHEIDLELSIGLSPFRAGSNFAVCGVRRSEVDAGKNGGSAEPNGEWVLHIQ